jgi:hypothetical protein
MRDTLPGHHANVRELRLADGAFRHQDIQPGAALIARHPDACFVSSDA